MPIAVGTALLISAGIAAATSGGSAAIKMIPTKSEKRLKAELEEAEERFRRGDIGLTAAEEARLQSQGLSAIQAAEREYLAREGELAALTGVTGGALIAQQRAAQDRAMKARADVGRQIRDLEMEKRAQDLEQLRLLQSAQAAVEAGRQEEAAQLFAEMGETAATTAGIYALESRFRAPAGTVPTDEAVRDPYAEELMLERLFAEEQAKQSLPRSF